MSKDGAKNAQSRDGMSKDGMKDAQSKDSMSKDGAKNAQSKDSMSKDGMKDAQSKDGMSKDSTAAGSGQQVRHHHRQRRNFGDRGTAGREAHPDHLRHPLGEDSGNHQRQLQDLGWHQGSGFGPLPSAPPADRRDLPGVARL